MYPTAGPATAEPRSVAPIGLALFQVMLPVPLSIQLLSATG